MRRPHEEEPLQPFAELIAASEEWLVRQVLGYAKEHGYTPYTPSQEEAWRSSIVGLSGSLLASIRNSPTLSAISTDIDRNDPSAAFGVLEAKRHRQRGTTIAMFFGLMKYYRRSYLDLVDTCRTGEAERQRYRNLVALFFDRIELAFVREWEEAGPDVRVAELQEANRALVHEKSLYFTVFESLPTPAILYGRGNRPVNHNQAAAQLLAEFPASGGDNYGQPTKQDAAARLFRKIRSKLATLRAGEPILLQLETRKGIRQFQVFGRELLDVSEKFAGLVLILSDISELKHAEETLTVLFAEEEKRVKNRTAELLRLNQKLTLEVKERRRAEQEVQRLNDNLERSVARRTEELRKVSEENNQKLQELSLLHRLSSPFLATVRVDKLAHLILTALTAGPSPVFERAMLFMINERSGILQGMLGVNRESSIDLPADSAKQDRPHSATWNMTDDTVVRQRESELCSQVKAVRIELNRHKNISSRAVAERRIFHIPDAVNDKRVDQTIVNTFKISSFAVAPLQTKDRVFGVVFVDNPDSGKAITREELHFLQLFTSQSGIAIENSLLYGSLEEANRRLREAQDQLLHGERLATIGEMAASIAHELKGPLVSIGGFARRLGKQVSKGSAEAEYAETIVAEVKRLEKLLSDTLSFSRKATICYNECAIADVVEDALTIIMPLLARSAVNVVKSYPRSPIHLFADCQQLKQIFINLFSNAHEAMQDRGELRITISRTTMHGKPAAAVKVGDTGGGIPQEAINRIFSSFYTTKATGTGLGLPIANRIVTNHGGKIQVKSQPGVGAEFTVILPLNG